jgi:hypothetical protein
MTAEKEVQAIRDYYNSFKEQNRSSENSPSILQSGLQNIRGWITEKSYLSYSLFSLL